MMLVLTATDAVRKNKLDIFNDNAATTKKNKKIKKMAFWFRKNKLDILNDNVATAKKVRKNVFVFVLFFGSEKKSGLHIFDDVGVDRYRRSEKK